MPSAGYPEPRVMFVGKYAEDGNLDSFVDFGRALGYRAAELGIRPIIGSDARSTLDLAVAQGAGRFANERGQRVAWFLYEPDDHRERFRTLPDGLGPPTRWVFPRSNRRWGIAHVSAVRDSDVVVAVGGHENTRHACRAGEERGIPVWPIPTFGGAAADRYGAMTSSTARDKSRATALREAHDAAAAGSVMEAALSWLARALASAFRGRRKRTYFLSYAHDDLGATDELELFLRRKGRGVLRDEISFAPGKDLDDEIAQAIASADEFLVVDSERARASTYVAREITLAQDFRAAGARSPERVLGILIDGMPPRTSIDPKVLHLLGRSRKERQQAIARVVQTEGRSSKARRRP